MQLNLYGYRNDCTCFLNNDEYMSRRSKIIIMPNTFGWISTVIKNGDNLCGFFFSLLHSKSLLKIVLF